MFNTFQINEAIKHFESFQTGEFTDEEVILLYQYYLHLLDITAQVKGLDCVAIYAAIQYQTYQGILYARELQIPSN